MTELSLRDRSKARRSRAIRLAAMRLFADQGYDATTIAQIAAVAEVSPRSVSMYFPTKLDIAQASSNASIDRLATALDEAPPGSDAVDTFMEWLSDEAHQVGTDELELRSAMVLANPFLSAAGSASVDRLARVAARVFARDLEVDEDHVAVRVSVGAFAGIFLQYELLPSKFADSDAVLRTVRAALTGALAGVRRTLDRD